jgi:crotonobetainyl-CoA:carnitine CoA-transferase CaiB-like acyl-CoA transferase
VQALSGLMSQIGVEGAEPCKVQVPAVDLTTGFLGAMAVLAALRERDRTGRGQYLDVNMYNASLMLQASGLASYMASGEVPKRIGSAAPYAAPNEAYRTADGWMMVAAYQPPRWKALCGLLGLEALVEDPRFAGNDARVRNRAALRDALEARLAARATADWLPELERLDIMCAPVADYAQVVASEQFAHARAAVEVPHRTGPVRLAGFLVGDRDTQARVRHAPPALGEHTREVLADYGFDATEIDALLATRAAIGPQEAGR